MKSYSIVWFDDEFNTSLESIKMQFDDYGIGYVGFESAEEGIKYVQTNYHEIDAIVIDGNFFRNKHDNAIDETGKALSMVVDTLKEIKFKKDIPYFVLSGKVNFRERKNPLVDILDIEKVFDKLNEEDTAQLCRSIIEKTDSSLLGNLKIKYYDVLLICNSNKLGEDCFEKISVLAQAVENPSLPGTSEDLFLPIRKILEKLFVKLSELKVIDPDLLSQKGWINGASAFLSNKHPSYENKSDVHPIIQDSIFRLITITQDSSHSEGSLRMKIDAYCNQFRSNYLYKSSIFLLFEVLTYFDKYIDEHQEIESNISLWVKKPENIVEISNQEFGNQELTNGTITKIAENGYGTFLPDNDTNNLTIIPRMVKDYKLYERQRIAVATEKNGERIHIKLIKVLT